MFRFLWIGIVLCTGWVEAGDRQIYRCTTAAGVVFADRPCGVDSQPYSPEGASVSIMTTVPAEPVKYQASPAKRTSAPKESDAHEKTCARIEQSLRKIASTQRSGYSAKQGERLRERKRQLEEQRRSNRC